MGLGPILRSELQTGTEPEEAGLQGLDSHGLKLPPALKRRSRRSLPTGHRAIPVRTSDLGT